MRSLPQHYLRAEVLRRKQSISELLEKLYEMAQEGKTETLGFSGQTRQYIPSLLCHGQVSAL